RIDPPFAGVIDREGEAAVLHRPKDCRAVFSRQLGSFAERELRHLMHPPMQGHCTHRRTTRGAGGRRGPVSKNATGGMLRRFRLIGFPAWGRDPVARAPSRPW